MNPGDLLIIGLAVRRRTRLGHPDFKFKKKVKIFVYKIQHYYFIFTYYINFFFLRIRHFIFFKLFRIIFLIWQSLKNQKLWKWLKILKTLKKKSFKWHIKEWTPFIKHGYLKNQLHPAVLQASAVSGRAAPFQAWHVPPIKPIKYYPPVIPLTPLILQDGASTLASQAMIESKCRLLYFDCTKGDLCLQRTPNPPV